jgi:superfamily II DNA or RNA helicase
MKTLDIFKPFDYQKFTVELGIQKIQQTGGVLIMDSTGLGKTITSLTIALNLEDTKKVLVITPNKNKIGWTNCIKQQKDLNVVLCGGHNIDDSNDFDLIIVDECHNYRNITAASYKKLWYTIRTQNRIPNVILLSATPVQNTIEEFKNTISLIPFKANTFAYLFLGNIINNITLNTKIINNINRYKGDNISYQDINVLVENNFKNKKLMEEIKSHLGEFCIRNTREYISEMYPTDMRAIGMFPTIIKNNNSYNTSVEFYNLVDYVYKVIGNDKLLPFARYNLQKYSKQNDNYIGMNGIMKSFLLKRLDSSLIAFKESVIKMIDNIQMILAQYDKSDFSNVTIDNDEYCLPSSFFDDCEKDILTLTEFLNKANVCSLHDKEMELLNIIKNSTGKSIIFTEYKATLNTICSFLKKNDIKYISIDGNSDDSELDIISKEFDANLPKKQQTNNYDVLVCTDVMSEGVNLHRAKTLIHYDSKWNPQKTIQRNGRVDRIFAEPINNHIINIYTFAIDKFIDSIIKFENKINTKLELSDQLLNFDWLNYKNFENNEFKIGKKYYVEKLGNKNIYYGFKLNSGYNLIILENYSTFYTFGDKKSLYTDKLQVKIISEDTFGNNSNVGGKVEYKYSDVFGYRGRLIYGDVLVKYIDINIHDIRSINNSFLNKNMIEIIAKEIMLSKFDTEKIEYFKKLFNNLVNIQGYNEIKYFQIVPEGIWINES